MLPLLMQGRARQDPDQNNDDNVSASCVIFQ